MRPDFSKGPGDQKRQGNEEDSPAPGPEASVSKDTESHLSSQIETPRSGKRRSRGFSLRRSLFKRNAEKPMSYKQDTFQMNSSEAQAEKDMVVHGLPTIVVEESKEYPDPGLRGSAAPLESDLDLPSYRRWLAKHAFRTTALGALTENYHLLKNSILPANAIAPSVDGRHVTVNVLETHLPLDERTGKPYVNNSISSCRYTRWNFAPKQLVAQFGKLANFYFLCVSILQMMPGLSTTGQYTTIIPLLIFVGVSMAKEGYDDIRRHRLDQAENELITRVLRPPSAKTSNIMWEEKRWDQVRVGDVVKVRRDESAPADLILLHVDNPTHPAYVETKSLDGETNLKSKQPPAALGALCQDTDAIARLAVDFVVEDPNLDLYKFDGRATVNGNVLPLTSTEVIYRGSVLRNTLFVFGLVVYSGEECRIRMNANKAPRTKAPTLQAKVNKVVIFVASLVVSLAVILTLAHLPWRHRTENNSWYLQGAKVPMGQVFTSFLIMLNTMLPLSLYISLEIVKAAQIFLMGDLHMYDQESDIPMDPHTSTLNEELGQVSYIFSDKTGTLTNNSMKFRKLSVAGTSWLHDLDLHIEAVNETIRKLSKPPKQNDEQEQLLPQEKASMCPFRVGHRSMVSARPSADQSSLQFCTRETLQRASNDLDLSLEAGKTQNLLEHIYRWPQSVFAQRARLLLLSIALCHTCIPEKDDQGGISYQAASPDEAALVVAAKDLGYIVTDRNAGSVTILTYTDGDDARPLYEIYEVLDVIEFSSARKRMSIVVRFPDNRICLITKGADSTIRQLLRLASLAASNVRSVERRKSQRKSIEIQGVLRRRSTQLSHRSGSLHGLDAALPRPSCSSFGPSWNERGSTGHESKQYEREENASIHRSRSQLYFPQPSMQLPFRRSEGHERKPHLSPQSTPRASMQGGATADSNDECLVLDDNAVFERCFQHVDDFATEGLRTLLYACRYLSDSEYGEWKKMYLSATTSLIKRQEKIESAAELLETNLELLGATGIEDKLQRGVPDAIERFRRAGIKIWMLTGDKRETAINIGQSCRLIKDYSSVVVLDHELGNLNDRLADAFALMSNETTAHSVLVVDGRTLTIIDTDPATKALFTDVAVRADSVICCRASPSQKASLVKTIRKKVKGSVTLAVGDGANDIAMIQEAHLGIGIAGKEGLQAARTSDYSIAQFRYLQKLLLVHGRWNYVRICKYLLGTLWKEMMFYLTQALYQRWNGYTGTSLYEPWSLTMFNTLFTSLPVVFMGVFEKDLAASTLLAFPELYNIGRQNRGFNFRKYFCWSTLAVCEAVLIYFIVYGIYGLASFTKDQELYALGDLAFSACIIIISLKLQAIELHNKTGTAVSAIVLSVGGWWLWNLILSVVYSPLHPIYNVNHAFLDHFGRNLLWWITLIVVVAAVCLLEMTIKTVKTKFWPSDVDVFQALEKDSKMRKRFEEAAGDHLIPGYDAKSGRSGQDVSQAATEQAELESRVEALLLKRQEAVKEQRSFNYRNHGGCYLDGGGPAYVWDPIVLDGWDQTRDGGAAGLPLPHIIGYHWDKTRDGGSAVSSTPQVIEYWSGKGYGVLRKV